MQVFKLLGYRIGSYSFEGRSGQYLNIYCASDHDEVIGQMSDKFKCSLDLVSVVSPDLVNQDVVLSFDRYGRVADIQPV